MTWFLQYIGRTITWLDRQRRRPALRADATASPPLNGFCCEAASSLSIAGGACERSAHRAGDLLCSSPTASAATLATSSPNEAARERGAATNGGPILDKYFKGNDDALGWLRYLGLRHG